MERNTEFEPIPLLEPLVYINEDIVNKMSTDSMPASKYLQAVVKAKLTLKLLILNVEAFQQQIANVWHGMLAALHE